MAEFWHSQLDYIFFFYGLSFFLLAAVCLSMSKDSQGHFPWRLLTGFACIHGANEWLDMLAISLGAPLWFQWTRLLILISSFVFLLEFGRVGCQAIKGFGLGRWIFLPMGILISLGFVADIPGVNAAARYTLGFLGGLLAAMALWMLSCESKTGQRSLRLAAVCMGCYAIAAGLIVRKLPFLPASLINETTFLKIFAVPVQLVRGLLACAITVSIWFYSDSIQHLRVKDPVSTRRNTYGLVLFVLAFLAGGFVMTFWVGKKADDEQRNEILEIARRVSSTISRDQILQLTAQPSDIDNAAYLRLKQHLQTLRGSLPKVRFVYLMRKHNGKVIFLVDSEPVESKDYSPPGSEYYDHTDKLARIFESGWEFVQGPTPDQWGVWVSAFIPVRDIYTHSIIAVLGVDRDVDDFIQKIALERLKTIFFVMMLCCSCIMAFLYQRHACLSEGRPQRKDLFIMWSPLIVTFFVGGAMTVMIFLQERDRMYKDLYEQFQQEGDERIVAVQHELFKTIEDISIVTRANDGVNLNNRSVSVRFVNGIQEIRHLMQSVQWIPRIVISQRQEYEDHLRQQGIADFQITQKDENGRFVSAGNREEYYPVLFSKPPKSVREGLGFDMATNPDVWSLMVKARDSGEPVVSSRIGSAKSNNSQVLLVSPVYRQLPDPDTVAQRQEMLDGFVTVLLTIRYVIESAVGGLAPEGLPFILEDLSASTPDDRLLYVHDSRIGFNLSRAEYDHLPKIENTFSFGGREWHITVFLGKSFLERNYFPNYWLILPVGLTMTTIFGLFVSTLLNSRWKADLLVREKTEQLVHEKERLTITLRAIGDGVIVFDASRRIVLMNKSAEVMTGWSEEEAKGKFEGEVFKIVDGQTKIACESITQRVLETGQPMELGGSTILTRRDGHELEVADSCAPIFANGSLLGAILVFRDVTSSRKAETVLKESEETLNTIIKHLPVGLFIIDCLTHRIVNVNEHTSRLVGLPKEEIIGKICHEFICPSANGSCPILDQHQTIDHSLRKLLKNGQEAVPVLKTVVPLQIKGRPHLLECIVDISDRIKNEEELKKAKEAAEAANKARSEFLANMSHEIRTPMNAVLGFVDLLKRTNLDAQQRGYLEIVSSSGEQLLTIINDILDISKIEAGQMLIEHINFNLSFLVEDVLKLMRSRVEGKNLKVFCEIASDVPVNLEGDPSKIYQVLVNLLGNGVKFSREGIVGLEVTLDKELDQDRIQLQFCVSDTGVGIPANQLETIFEKFTQVDMSVTRPYGGTGLGLSICKSMIEAMGGKIWVESELGVGSKFYFTLVTKKRSTDSLDGVNPVAPKDLVGRRVLIIDDNPKNLELLGAACREMGMEAFLASSGLQALGWLSRRLEQKDPLPDLVLTDILMPYMDGWKLIKEIRQIESCQGIKMVAISSDIRVGTAASLQEAGFGGFLPKPVLKKELLAVLMTVLGDHRRGGEIVTRHMAGELACKGVQILLVDDSLANQTLMKAYFDLLGCVVDYASNGQQAVDMIRANPGKYQVCFMDLHMPQMDGYTAAQKIRTELSKDLPVVALTAATSLEDYRKCIDSGMNDHLSKPIQLGALRERIIKFSKKIPRKHS